MTNIIDARYPKGKVETMSYDFFSTSKVLEGMRENLPMLSGADLDDLKDAITDELETRKRKQVIEIKEKAIQALRDFFDAGGSIIAGGHDYSMIGEDFNLDEPIIFLS